MIRKKLATELARARCDDDLTRFRKVTHPRCIAGCAANNPAGRVGDNKSRGDSNAHGKISRNLDLPAALILDQRKPGMDGALCRVLPRCRIPKVGKNLMP